MNSNTRFLSLFTSVMLIVGLLSLCTGLSLPSQQSVKIISYNIHHGKDMEGNDQIRAMAEFIKASHADVIALQEVDSVCTRSGQVDQTAELARIAGMQGVFLRHFSFQGGAYGQALLSKYPIDTVEAVRLPVVSDNGQQTVVMLIADISITDTQRIRLVNVHLDYRSSESRDQQVQLIIDRLKTSELPIVFTGDLNAVPESPEIERLMRELQLTDTHQKTDYTFPTNNPDRKIDYILVGAGMEPIDSQVPEITYSDHLPIISEVRINGNIN